MLYLKKYYRNVLFLNVYKIFFLRNGLFLFFRKLKAEVKPSYNTIEP